MVARFLIPLIIISAGCTVLKKNPTRGNPPGTVQINDTLFIDQIEVANVHWREYLSGVEKNETKYQDALPDTSVWSDLVRKQDTGMLVSHTTNPLTEYYFRHPSYNNYPVVGISYGQALEFCKWRTIAANFSNYIDENHIKNYKDHLNDKFPIKFYYRLPTKKEWEMIAGNTSSNKEGVGEGESYSKWRGRSMKSFNCLYPNDRDRPDSIAFYTADCKSFFKNSFGCYNMIGNVAEMVSEKGIAKGGSFFHQLDSCKIAIDQKYSHPQAWLGFRCVAVKVK